MDWKTLAVFLGALISAMALWWRIYLHYISRGRAKLSGVLQVELDSNGKVPEELKRVIDLTAVNPGNERIVINENIGMALKKSAFNKELIYPEYTVDESSLELSKEPLVFQFNVDWDYDKFKYILVVDSTGGKYKLRKRKIKIQLVHKIHYRGPGIVIL